MAPVACSRHLVNPEYPTKVSDGSTTDALVGINGQLYEDPNGLFAYSRLDVDTTFRRNNHARVIIKTAD